jgi:hypothetical protein
LASKVSTQNASGPMSVTGAAPPFPQKSVPYLRVIGYPSLRFQDALPTPDLSAEMPRPKPEQTSAKQASSVNASPAPSRPAASRASIAEAPSPASKPTETADQSNPPPPVDPAAAPLLSDDVAPKVRPEDFLPFFQYPRAGRANGGTFAAPVPPAPGTLPPSTATYKQE